MSDVILKIRPGIVLLLLMLCSWSSFIWAAPESNPQSYNFKQLDTAPVVVNGQELFDIIGIRAYPARERADRTADIIEEIADDISLDPDSITIEVEDHLTLIMLGDKRIIAVLDADAEYVGVKNRQTVVDVYLKRIKNGIEAYRLDRTPEQIKKNLLKAAGRTLVLIIILLALRWIFRGIDKLTEKLFARRIRKLEAKSMRMVQSEQVWRAIHTVMKLLKTVLVLALIYFFLNFVLTLFPWTRHMAHRLLELIADPIKSMAVGFVDYLPSLFFLIILVLVTRYLLRLLNSFFDAIHYQNMHLNNFDAEWARPTYRIVRVVVILFSIVIAYPYIPGSNSDAFKGVSLFLGVLLSLGSTSVISNIMAGYTMTYRRAFKVGDRVRIGEHVGDVLDIRLLVTHMNSLKNEKVVIPNSTILNADITNYSALQKGEGLILHTRVGIGYETPWRQVEAMLIEAASLTPGLMKEPAPFVLQPALTDFAVTYELNVYCKDPSHMVKLYSELHRRIQDVFNKYGVQIMTPNYVADTADAKLVPAEQWYTPPASKPVEES